MTNDPTFAFKGQGITSGVTGKSILDNGHEVAGYQGDLPGRLRG